MDKRTAMRVAKGLAGAQLVTGNNPEMPRDLPGADDDRIQGAFADLGWRLLAEAGIPEGPPKYDAETVIAAVLASRQPR